MHVQTDVARALLLAAFALVRTPDVSRDRHWSLVIFAAAFLAAIIEATEV